MQMRETAPSVEVRPRVAYESVALGGCSMTPIDRLQASLTSLGLKAVEARLENLLEQAVKKAPAYDEFLDELLGCEVDARRSRHLRTRLQLANLPFVKTFDQFDLGFQPSIDEKQIREQRSLHFLHEASNVILLGPPGEGKTHLSVALAEATIQSGSELTSSRHTTWWRKSAGPIERFDEITDLDSVGPHPLCCKRGQRDLVWTEQDLRMLRTALLDVDSPVEQAKSRARTRSATFHTTTATEMTSIQDVSGCSSLREVSRVQHHGRGPWPSDGGCRSP
jgi:hypothetical protein